MSLEELNSRYNIFTRLVNIKKRDKGRLSNLKFSIKDIIDIKGVPTTAGSRILNNYIPDSNAYVVEKILEEGGEIIGKTNTHEFAMGATNTSSIFGPVKNPYDVERISGGSSGGAAVSVALGLVDVGVGTDTGGSVRIPAALCGVIGFKPSIGLIPTDGIIPFSWSIDTVGFLVKDMQTLNRVLEVTLTDKTVLVSQIRRKPRVGLFLFGDDEVSRVLKPIVDTLNNYFDIKEIHNEILEKYSGDVRRKIVLPEAYSYHKKWFNERKDDYFPDVRRLLENGSKILGYEYVDALRLRHVLIREYMKIFSDVDVLISPTTKVVAPKISEVIGNELTFREKLVSNTEIFNVTGAPSISIPVTQLNGLPVGLMVSGELYQDGTVLDIAKRILDIVGFISK
ncbi:amidase [Sulfolobus acidocaldarius SUSAZ]|nr:amidase [Sulfolobus acidocaldarius SUSAZ]